MLSSCHCSIFRFFVLFLENLLNEEKIIGAILNSGSLSSESIKKTIKDFDLNGKKVIIRVDFNVPIKGGIIQDDTRIKASLKTIKYAIDNNAKVILLSHLGKVKEEYDENGNLIENDEQLKVNNKTLEAFLNGFIVFKRGAQPGSEGPMPATGKESSNNMLHKTKIT